MAFIERSLSKGEQLEARFRLHWINYLGVIANLLMAAAPVALLTSGLIPELPIKEKAVSLAVLAFAAYFAVKALWRWLVLKKTELGVTNKRIIKKTGVFTRRTDEMKITSIETITLRQGVMGAVMNFGNLFVTGKGVSDVAFINVKHPVHAKQTIESVDLPAGRDE